MKVRIGKGEMTLGALAEVCGGKLFLKGLCSSTSFSYIATDSREVDAETLFAAMRGERVDGHDYMEKAIALGGKVFLCERIPSTLMDKDVAFGAVLVENTEKALGILATAYSDAIEHKTVAVTGSVGKTTTKEWIAAVLGEKYVLHKTKANHNSTLGMPMSLLEMEECHTASVLEMGMSGFGEISYMSRIAKPDIACITNIGTSHMEILGSRENICRAKLEILDGLAPTGVVIANGDEILLSPLKNRGGRSVFVSVDAFDTDYHAVNIRYGEGDTTFDVVTADGRTLADIHLDALGKPFVYGALFAIAVGFEMGMDEASVRAGLARFQNAAMRQNITEQSGITIIEDCYNASPESMRAAADIMKTLTAQKGGARCVAILGDMRELGEQSEMLHREVGAYFARAGLDVLLTTGELAAAIALGAAEAGMTSDAITVFHDCEEREAIADRVLGILKKGDILLVKASRAIGAEKTLAIIREKL